MELELIRKKFKEYLLGIARLPDEKKAEAFKMYKENSEEFFKEVGGADLELPKEKVFKREPGELSDRGWIVKYRFGVEGGREFVDLLIVHRMTNERLVRIFEDGQLTEDNSLDLGFVEDNDDVFDKLKRERGF